MYELRIYIDYAMHCRHIYPSIQLSGRYCTEIKVYTFNIDT